MEVFRLYILPLALIMAGLIQVTAEMRAYRAEASPDRRRRIRLGRRAFASLILVGVGVMLHFGQGAPAPQGDQETILRQFYYWMGVLGLVMLVVAMAIWDAVDSLRTLHSHIETMQKDEMETLRGHLQVRGRDR